MCYCVNGMLCSPIQKDTLKFCVHPVCRWYVCSRRRPPNFQPTRCPVFLGNSRYSMCTCSGDRQAVRSTLRKTKIDRPKVRSTHPWWVDGGRGGGGLLDSINTTDAKASSFTPSTEPIYRIIPYMLKGTVAWKFGPVFFLPSKSLFFDLAEKKIVHFYVWPSSSVISNIGRLAISRCL
jgi:hypothetical protein